MKKVVFLDIDGVLQPDKNHNRFENNLDELKQTWGRVNPDYLTLDKWDMGATYFDWDLGAVDRLRKLLKLHDAKIVISSNWRTSKNLHKLRLLFNFYDLDKYVADVTVILDFKRGGRSAEIQQYLDTHPEIEKFVILDDYRGYFEGVFTDTFVYCPDVFNNECFAKANEILK